MVITHQEDKNLSVEIDITELEKGLDTHSFSSSTVTSVQFLDENQTDDNYKKVRKSKAALAENRLKDVNNTDKHDEPSSIINHDEDQSSSDSEEPQPEGDGISKDSWLTIMSDKEDIKKRASFKGRLTAFCNYWSGAPMDQLQ